MSFGYNAACSPPPQGRFGWWEVSALTLAIIAFLWWAALGSEINATNLWNGFPYMWDFLVR
jgi:phosphonate transport system permease protein